MRAFGFTLIDLLITLTVLSILLAFALPNLSAQVQDAQVKTATQTLLDSLELTRTHAVFANNRTTIRKQIDWVDGWEVFIDTNNDGILNNNETTIQKHEKLTGVRIIANRPVKNYVSFIGSGEGRNASGSNNTGAFQAGTFTICPKGQGKGYELILARGGRVRTNKIEAYDCSII
jgi:type IV fimbrial biogenesis protein FimT